jgi:dipeptidyl-peptidase-3
VKLRISVLFCLSVFRPIAIGQSQKPAATAAAPGDTSGPLVARVGDTGFVQVRAESFDALTPQQKALAYWLTQASIAIDPIIYDQLSPFGLRQKRLLEEIVAHPGGIDSGTMARITEFAELLWANRGNHNENT